MKSPWTNFRMCFSATPGCTIRRLAGWVYYYNGSWWVKRHVCSAAEGLSVPQPHSILAVVNEEAGADAAPWVQAKTREGCMRYLARAVLLELKNDPTDGGHPEWAEHVKGRAELALKRGGRIWLRLTPPVKASARNPI